MDALHFVFYSLSPWSQFISLVLQSLSCKSTLRVNNNSKISALLSFINKMTKSVRLSLHQQNFTSDDFLVNKIVQSVEMISKYSIFFFKCLKLISSFYFKWYMFMIQREFLTMYSGWMMDGPL